MRGGKRAGAGRRSTDASRVRTDKDNPTTRGRGRPNKSVEAIALESMQVWTYLDHHINAGWKLEAAVQAAMDHFDISRATVFKHIDTVETVGVWMVLRMKDDIHVKSAFETVGLGGLLKRLFI